MRKQCLYDLKTRGHSERLIYTCLSLISEYAPFQTLRTVYPELLRLLFWGNPLQEMLETQCPDSSPFFHCLERMLTCLEQRDVPCFASTLQFLLLHDLRRIVEVLEKLGIEEATNILIPDIDDF